MTLFDAPPAPQAQSTVPTDLHRFLWYWPFARPEDMAIAAAFADGGGELLVEVIDRPAAPSEGHHGQARVVRDLPEVDRQATGLRWPASRTSTYARRASQRRAAIAEFAPDIVHYHYLNRFTDRFARPETTWVASVHDVEPHQPRLGRLERRLLADLYRRPDGLVVHHQWLADQLVGTIGLDPETIAVVPIPVFPVDAPAPRPVTDRPTVLLFGALRPNKGIEWMIEMMGRPELADHRLHLAGRGDAGYQRRIADLAAAQPNVTAELGYVSTERKDELFRAASVVVLPYETFSSQSAVLHDAYGHGRPVVVTDVGALGDTVSADGTGEIVAFGDSARFSAAIVGQSGPEGDAASAAARRIAAEQTPARMAARLRAAYERFARSATS